MLVQFISTNAATTILPEVGREVIIVLDVRDSWTGTADN